MNRYHVCSRAPLIFLMALLCLSVLQVLFPSRMHDATISVAGLMGLGAVGVQCFVSRQDRDQLLAWLRSLLFAFAAMLTLLLVYYVNNSHRWADGVGLLPVKHIKWLPGTAYPHGTLALLSFSIAAVAVYGCSVRMCRSSAKWFSACMVAGGLSMSVLVISQRLTPKPFPVYEFTGIFASENHFAAFANLILPLALVGAARVQYNAFQRGKLSDPSIFLYAIAGVLAAAVYLSRSRAGLAVMGLTMVLFIVLQWRIRRQHPFIAAPVSFIQKGMVAAIVFAVASTLLIGLTREWHHISMLGKELAFRWQLFSDTASIWLAHPWWGTGPGTYEVVLPYYQSEALEKFVFQHAHCEPIEFLAEYGFLGCVFMVLAVFTMVRKQPGPAEPCNVLPPYKDLERWGFVIGLVACGIHSLIDFPLRMSVIALMVAAWVGVIRGAGRCADHVSS